MDAKKVMHDSIDQLAIDVLKLQDITIIVRRDMEDLHVSPEHKEKLTRIKDHLITMHERLESVHEFVLSCQRRAEHADSLHPHHNDVWL